MANSRTIELLLKLRDNISPGLKAVTNSNKSLAKSVSETRKRLQEVNRTAKDLDSYRKMRIALRENSQAMKAVDQSSKGAQAKLKKLRAEQRSLQMTLGPLRTSLRQAGVDTNRLGTSSRKLKSDSEALNRSISTQVTWIKRLSSANKALNTANKAGSAVHRAGMGIGMHGAVAMYGGIRAGRAAMNIMQPGIAFGEQMSELQAVSRLSKNNPMLAAMEAQARELGANTAFTATESAGAQTFLARAGFTPQAILSSMQDVLELALANGTDLARTADIASNISGAFKIDPEVEGNMRRVADVLSGVSARANVDLEMLGETMKYMGKAEGLDISLEQAAAMAGLLGNIGIQGSMAGTTMRAMMDRISAPAAEGSKALDALGLSAKDSKGNLRNIEEIIGDVAWATEKMGNVEQAKVLKDIFGVQAGSGMAELIKQQGSGALGKLVKELQNVNGENANMAKTRSDNWGGDIKNLNSAWQEVGISLTKVNEGPLRQLTQEITGNIRELGKWINTNQEQVLQWAKWAMAIIALTTALGAVLVVIAPILMAIGGMIKMLVFTAKATLFAFKGIVLLAKGLGLFLKLNMLLLKGGGLLLGFLKTLTMAFLGFFKTLLVASWAFIAANPITAIIVGIIALIAAGIYLWKNWDTLGPKLKAIWDSIYRTIGDALGGIVTFFTDIWQELGGAWDNGWLDFTLTVGRMIIDWNPLGLLYTVFAKMINYLGGDLPETFSGLGKSILTGLWEGLKSILPDITGIIDTIGGLLPTVLKEKLGIKSPSRVFAELGVNTLEGYNQGLDKEQRNTVSYLADFSKKITATAAGITFATGIAAAPISAANAQAMAAPSVGDNITINVYAQQGQSAQDIAAEIERILAQRERRQAVRQGSRLGD